MSVTALHRTTIAQLAEETQGDGRLLNAPTWGKTLRAFGLDAEDVQRSAQRYFDELLTGSLDAGCSFTEAHAHALGALLAHGLLWGERL